MPTALAIRFGMLNLALLQRGPNLVVGPGRGRDQVDLELAIGV
jgi:hypothetical protein